MRKISLLISVATCLAWGPLGPVSEANASTRSQHTAVNIGQTQIDLHFIRLVEGSTLKGYVPLVHSTNSGVTIAHGFDLGQMSRKEFQALPLDQALKSKLQPYVGLKKYKALNYLKKHPLTITPAELQELNKVAANRILQPLTKYYHHATGQSFLDLPAAAQTALFSYAYQHGPAFMHQPRSQKFWTAFIKQDWTKAGQHLRQSKSYQSRRIKEALLLETLA
jgi:GH24 family phage-related lysozyme (muramidase)